MPGTALQSQWCTAPSRPTTVQNEQLGTATVTRVSQAAAYSVATPPPELPIISTRLASTSGSEQGPIDQPGQVPDPFADRRPPGQQAVDQLAAAVAVAVTGRDVRHVGRSKATRVGRDGDKPLPHRLHSHVALFTLDFEPFPSS